MNPLPFYLHKTFMLKPQAWGEADHTNIIHLLDNVILNFYANLDANLINGRPVLVAHASLFNPPKTSPEFITFNGTSFIVLTTQNMFWSQYVYQFSHELCHYVIDTPFPPKIDKFGWFEESICELASLFTLDRMALSWQTNPPYSNWTAYSNSLKEYVDNLIKAEENRITIPLNQWLNENLEVLYGDRVNRPLNRIVALGLLPVFKSHPQLWKCVQHLKSVGVRQEMSFSDFLVEWKKHLPSDLIIVFSHMEDVLLKRTGS